MTDAILSKGTPTNFELAIPKLPSMTVIKDVDKVILHLHEVVLPAMNIETIPRFFMGVQVDEQATHNTVQEDWEISFTVDARLSNWLALYEWMNFITSAKNPIDGHYLPLDHMINCSLLVTDNFKNPILNVAFVGVWLQRLGEVRFANRDGEQILESTATLKYQYYTIEQITT